ncbi:hotdog fold thioesterase [Aeromicrobium sp. 636]|uniref:PaaI family thioesterase n=1 Tax=Aeromicrobium senzhongii TaxID=2663859 RepID=A0A8I0EXE8_9ACTN|nr:MULTISPECIES: PaaI family thioesterase [Aeromicrobium]MBC9226865.1 PaaI family thioesterase [Aeromicrobium senzhongii]MCQ3998965.1 hotdog fold thioesterase [Aeromicrobium sp. 636]MTB89529.1 hotdog fold thioesterase [Aeromicrobium senzhongii]QNL94340.1 PaaI family thioesterase [Aeromicrobium senzhongii]
MSEIPGLDGVLGVEHVELTPDKVVVRFTITDRHLQPFGIPHGGIYCAVHESTASMAGQIWLGTKGVVVGTNNSTDFLRQARNGDTITTTATPIHRGRTQQLWHLDSVNQEGKLIAQGQVRLANLDQEVPPEAVAAMQGNLTG